jgi:hypothetical protein
VPLAPETLGLRRISGVDSLSIATAGGRSLLVFRSSGDVGCDHDGCYRDTAHALDLAPGAAPFVLEASGTGISPQVDVSTLVMGGTLMAVTQGHRGAAAMEGEHDRLFVTHGAVRALDVRAANGGAFVGAATASGALIVIAGWEAASNGQAPASVRALTLREGAKKAPSELLAWGMSDERFEQPTLSIDGENAAAAFVFQRVAGTRCSEGQGCSDHTATTRLEAVWLDLASGAPVRKRATIATGAVSSPAVLVRAEELSLLWSEAGTLRSATSTRQSGAAEPAVETLVIAGREPTLARLPGGHIAVAFASKGAIALGTGPDLRAAASTATSAGAHARAPRLAIDDAGEGHLAWLEKGPSGHAIVHRSVSCQ